MRRKNSIMTESAFADEEDPNTRGGYVCDGDDVVEHKSFPEKAEEKVKTRWAHAHLASFLKCILASAVLHFPGLYELSKVDGRVHVMLKAILASCFEGVLLLNVLVVLVSKRLLWTSGIAIFIGMQSVFFMLSNVQFMKKTELPDMPDMFTIMGGSKETVIAEMKNNAYDMFCLVFSGFACAMPAVCFVKKESRNRVVKDKICYQHIALPMMLAALVVLYQCNAWMPIFHTYASMCGIFLFSPSGSSNEIKLVTKQQVRGDHLPNVVLIMHESLSGEYTLTSHTAVKAMPFFQRHFQGNEEEFFVFENSRAVSGDTIDCMTGDSLQL